MTPSPRAVATALLLAWALVGCSPEPDDPPPPTPSAASAEESTPTPTSTPASPPAETPPPLPPEAQVADAGGAAAFIRHYFDVVNYAYRTGDVAAVRATRADDCQACQEIESEIGTAYEGGGRIEGGHAGVTDVAVTPGDLSTYAEAVTVLSIAPAQYIAADETVTHTTASEPDLVLTVLLERDRESWRLLEWGRDDGIA